MSNGQNVRWHQDENGNWVPLGYDGKPLPEETPPWVEVQPASPIISDRVNGIDMRNRDLAGMPAVRAAAAEFEEASSDRERFRILRHYFEGAKFNGNTHLSEYARIDDGMMYMLTFYWDQLGVDPSFSEVDIEGVWGGPQRHEAFCRAFRKRYPLYAPLLQRVVGCVIYIGMWPVVASWGNTLLTLAWFGGGIFIVGLIIDHGTRLLHRIFCTPDSIR